MTFGKCSFNNLKMHLFAEPLSIVSGTPGCRGIPVGNRGVTRLDGTRGKKFGTLMFEPEFFRKQMYCIEKSTCDIVRTFRRPPRSNFPPP